MSGTAAPASPVLVLLNPRAAGGQPLRWRPRIEAALLAMGAVADVHIAASVEDSRRVLALRAKRRVVLVGGDGSVGPLLPELLAGRHTLGLVPCGTGNDLARALGVFGLGLEAALHHAVRADARPMDLGQLRWSAVPVAPGQDEPPVDAIHTALFASSLTVGFDSVVSYRAETSPRRLPGQLHYLWATLAELRVLSTWSIHFNGVADAAPELLHMAPVLNTPSYGSGMPVAPAARIDDGVLHLLRVRQTSRPRLLGLLARMLRGQHLGDARVALHDLTQLGMGCDKPLPLGTDGNFIGQARWLRVACLPGALPVVCRAA